MTQVIPPINKEVVEAWLQVLPGIESFIKEAEKEAIDIRYNSGKINGGRYYHAGSTGDAYLMGRKAALKYFHALVTAVKEAAEANNIVIPSV